MYFLKERQRNKWNEKEGNVILKINLKRGNSLSKWTGALLGVPLAYETSRNYPESYLLVRETLPPTTSYFHPPERRETSLQEGFTLSGTHKKRLGEIIGRFEKKNEIGGVRKHHMVGVLGFVPAQHKDDPQNIKLCQPKAWLKGAGLDPQSFTVEVIVTLLFGQSNVSQANFNINRYFKVRKLLIKVLISKELYKWDENDI